MTQWKDLTKNLSRPKDRILGVGPSTALQELSIHPEGGPYLILPCGGTPPPSVSLPSSFSPQPTTLPFLAWHLYQELGLPEIPLCPLQDTRCLALLTCPSSLTTIMGAGLFVLLELWAQPPICTLESEGHLDLTPGVT